MKLVYWNICGISNSDICIELSNICHSYHPDLVCIFEPMFAFNSIPFACWNSFGPFVLIDNTRGGLLPNIWVLYSTDYCSPPVISSPGQHITFQASFDDVLSQFTIVYATTTSSLRRAFWCDLLNIHSITTVPWMSIGDFNAILGAHEQMGGHLPSRTSCEDFCSTTKFCDFTHMETTSAFYIWSNGWSVRGYMERRLDHSLCDSRWLQSWPYTSCSTLPWVVFLSQLSCYLDFCYSSWRTPTFPISSMWTLHTDFLICCPMFIMMEKLKVLKHCLRDWNINVFGNVHRNFTFAKERHIISSDGNSQERFSEEVVAKTVVLDALCRHSSSKLVILLDGDNALSSPTDIAGHVVKIYRSLYNSQLTPSRIEDISDVIPHMVSEEENLALSFLLSADEIKNAVFSMDPKSALGPDRFSDSFY
ncbi:unnamed protein product [Malus baccata var. baccata]